jgi:hypothetical protein
MPTHSATTIEWNEIRRSDCRTLLTLETKA